MCVHLCVCVCVCSKALLDTHTHTHTHIFYSPLFKLLKVMESSWPLCTKWVLLPYLLAWVLSFLPSFFLSTPISCVSRLYFNFWLVEIASLWLHFDALSFPFSPSFLGLCKPFTSPPKGGDANCTFYHFWWLPNLSTYQVGFLLYSNIFSQVYTCSRKFPMGF